MRNDELARVQLLDRWGVARQPAQELYRQRVSRYRHTGAEVSVQYGLLVHYTTVDVLAAIVELGRIGGNAGCWLTPIAYAACIVPYDLGLASPRDICLLVDVTTLTELWGPGTSPRSSTYPSIWRGGGVEFFSPDPIPLECLHRIVRVEPCGDTHL